MTTPTMTLTPRRAAVLAGFESTVDVLVRVTPPAPPQGERPKRPPLHVALVIDRSGSMDGQPLDEAKKAAAFVVEGLGADDQAALITYDTVIKTVVPLTPVAERETFQRAIRTIESGGSTDLHGGWFAGAESLAPHAGPQNLSRVILLSDGCANAGLTDPAEIFAQCKELAATGVTTSTYGLGHGFNEDLMIGMARAGRGNHYYGQTAADLMDPFREELALLNALCATHVRLQLTPAPNIRMRVLNAYDRTSAGEYCLPDLAYGGEAWALVRLTVPADVPVGDAQSLLTASITYRPRSGVAGSAEAATLVLPAVPAGAFNVISENELVARRAMEIEAAELQITARRAAQQRDWRTVDRLLAKARERAKDHPWVQSVIEELEQLAARRDDVMFAKEAQYSALRMQSRLAPAMESLSLRDDEELFLRRKMSQGRAPSKPPGGSKK
jgi:Ca-activated chloride channel family protein